MDWVCFQPEPDVGLGCVYFLSYCLGNDENNKECGEKQTLEASRSFMKQANFVYILSISLLSFREVAQNPTVLCLCSL